MKTSHYYTLVAATESDTKDEPAVDDLHTTTGEESSGHGEESGGLDAFGLDPVAFLFQLGAVIVFYMLFRKFALKKVVASLDERHETIEQSLKDAKQIGEDLEKTQEQQALILVDARKQADDIIAEAGQETKKLLADAEAKASDKQAKMLADAKNQIESETKAAKAGLQKEVKGMVADAVEAILGEKLDAKADAKLIEKSLKESGDRSRES